MTGGSLLVSDDLPKLPAERLRLAEVLLPVLGQRARVVDGFDAEMPTRVRLDELNATGEGYLLAQFNWQETAAEMQIDPKAFGLDETAYQVCDFWQETTGVIAAGGSYSAGMFPGGGHLLQRCLRNVDTGYLLLQKVGVTQAGQRQQADQHRNGQRRALRGLKGLFELGHVTDIVDGLGQNEIGPGF